MKRHVAYIRQSLHDSSSSSPERQRDIIEAWAKTHNIVISQYYIDVGGKRSESDNVLTRPSFQALLADADAQKFDCIVVSSQDRFGTSDFYEFVTYLDRFNKHGIELWDAGKNALLNAHGTEPVGILQSTLGTIIETGEQVVRSRNTITGQSTKAKTGAYLGGKISFGVAVQCVTTDGTVRWSCEMVGRKLYETIYRDGRVTVEPYTPCGSKAPSDRLLFCRSKYNDRIIAIQNIFKSFLNGAGINHIAGEMNHLGYRLPGGRLFYSGFIHNVLVYGHVYTGKTAFFKASSGKFHQGGKLSPVPVKNLKGSSKTRHDIADWLVSEEVFEPIISMEDYLAARTLLISKARPRVRQNPRAVYAGLLVCCECGTRMSSCGDAYRCTTYMNKGGTGSSCYSNTIVPSVIDMFVDKWLKQTCNTLAWTTEKSPVTSLYTTSSINERHRSLMVLIEQYLADKLAQVFSYTVDDSDRMVFEIPDTHVIETSEGTETYETINRVRLPGYDGSPGYLQDLLGTIEASVNSSQTAQVAAWEARKAHLMNIFPDAQNKSLRDSLVKELNILDSQIELARSSRTDYASQHRELIVQLHEIWRDSKRALTIEAPQARRKAIMKLISEIKCSVCAGDPEESDGVETCGDYDSS